MMGSTWSGWIASRPVNPICRLAREWARAHGYRVADTGRLPAEVLAAWKAHTSPAARQYDTADRALAQPSDSSPGRVGVPHAYRFLHTVLHLQYWYK